MSANQPTPNHAPIPESLHRQLVEFRRHLWRIKVFEALAAGVVGLLVSFLLVYGLDRVWVTPVWARLAILAAGASLFALFAPYWLHRWVWRHRREAQLARLITRRFPGLGDRLLGVIELQDQEESPDTLSPRLRGAAMEAVALETGRRSLGEALPPPRHLRWGLALLVLVGGAAAALTLTPRAGINALQRWLMPLSDTERYTFTRLANPPTALSVPYGEAFDVTLTLAPDTEQRPGGAVGRYGLQPQVRAQLDGQSYRFAFPGQQEQGRVAFRVGDAIHEMTVTPLQRPFVQQAAAIVTPPAYLRLPERSVDLSGGVLNAVEGSTVRIRLTTNRELAQATYGPTRAVLADMVVDGAGEPAATPPPAPPAYTPVSGALALHGNESLTSALEVGKVSFEVPFAWRDRHGLTGQNGFRVRVDAAEDAAPACYIQGVERQRAILETETVPFEILAEDDFGIRTMGFEYQGEFTKPSPDTPAKGEVVLVEDASGQSRLAGEALFSPKAFGIQPQKITIRAFAQDDYPDRGRVYSEPIVIYILTRDEHAQMLKSNYDRVISGLEELARIEENLLDETKRLDALDGEQLQQDENHKRLETQEQAEAENTRRMQELTERMEQLMKDAARNGDIDEKTMRKMAESLKQMQELGTEDMPEVQRNLAESQEPSNTPEKTDQSVEQAREKQQEAVDKMKEAVEKANDANDRMEGGTFVNRLKRAASEEDSIAAALIQAFEDLLGVKSAAVDPKDERKLTAADKQQADTASDVRWIQEDMGHYHARTEKPAFKEVFDAMRESAIDVGLEELRQKLKDNHTYLATESAKNWSAKLNEWAAKLEGELNKDQQGGESGDAGSSSEDEDFEFMLRVMRMVQQQQDLRAQTRALEQLRRTVEPPAPMPDGGQPDNPPPSP